MIPAMAAGRCPAPRSNSANSQLPAPEPFARFERHLLASERSEHGGEHTALGVSGKAAAFALHGDDARERHARHRPALLAHEPRVLTH